MHKLIDYICDEMEDLERKVEKGGKLSMQEIQYMDTLAHAKKNILTADAMEEADYSNDYSGRDYAGRDYSTAPNRGRGSRARRDSMGRYASDEMGGYSRGKMDLKEDLRELERNASDDETRRMIQRWMRQLEG